MNKQEAMQRIAKRKMIERGMAQKQTRDIMSELPKCSHGNFPIFCKECRALTEPVIPF